jgi:trans-aconitate methyltransferase
MAGTGTASHWDDAYAHGDATRSWFQRQPVMSLRMLDAAGVTPDDSVIDVGGGASALVDVLLDRGFADVTVLDISQTAIRHARERLGPRASAVQWLAEDLLAWQPRRSWKAWHDRAVYHFLTRAADKRRYRQVLHDATSPGAVAVLGCFAPHGPERCSGLPVARYSAADLERELDGWALISQALEEHVTPAGVMQPFTWVALRRQA